MAKHIEANEKTKRSLRDAFWTLYQQKPIEKISVREITDLAKLNRCTFYEYYESVYAVLEEIEDSILQTLFLPKFDSVLDLNLTREDIFYGIVRDYKIHSKYLDVLLGEDGDPRFKERLKERLKSVLRPVLFPDKGVRTEYVLEYMTGGLISLLTYWQSQKPVMKIEEFLEICQHVAPIQLTNE